MKASSRWSRTGTVRRPPVSGPVGCAPGQGCQRFAVASLAGTPSGVRLWVGIGSGGVAPLRRAQPPATRCDASGVRPNRASRSRTECLEGPVFARRYLLHVLPKGLRARCAIMVTPIQRPRPPANASPSTPGVPSTSRCARQSPPLRVSLPVLRGTHGQTRALAAYPFGRPALAPPERKRAPDPPACPQKTNTPGVFLSGCPPRLCPDAGKGDREAMYAVFPPVEAMRFWAKTLPQRQDTSLRLTRLMPSGHRFRAGRAGAQTQNA